MVAVACIAVVPAGSYAQVKTYMDDDGYCISGPVMTYEKASDYHFAEWKNRCSFSIKIGYTRWDSFTQKSIPGDTNVPANSSSKVLIYGSSSVSWNEISRSDD